MRVAYADPPYVGCAHLYGEAEVDHAELIARLVGEFPDGWALSCHVPSLRELLPLCPDDTRIMAWVKPFAIFKSTRVAYAWEPVLVRGGRPWRRGFRKDDTVRDWISAVVRQDGFKGAKPDAFCFWLFDVLGLLPEDELVDLYLGSGAVTRAWETWKRQTRLPLAASTTEACRGSE